MLNSEVLSEDIVFGHTKLENGWCMVDRFIPDGKGTYLWVRTQHNGKCDTLPAEYWKEDHAKNT